ncbi:hypothetical protein NPIL_697051 [Nephila pilipes]|uniref:Transcriptional coactivator p15 (PC4) C-terminal domain-containing protein n=1 Tax=Nephila pilipes TaxID=299642 RepID=A0A8X6Q7M6_NEPPI|nr:hypothetical protein NPIL_697051 [Nephila pilipes]
MNLGKFFTQASVLRYKYRGRSNNDLDAILEHYFPLGGENCAAVSYFFNIVKIHLRQYKNNPHGHLFPTKKGVTLSPLLWQSL